MGKPLAITQKQITAICKGAKAAGCIAEVIIGGVTVRLVPGSMPPKVTTAPEEFETLTEYLVWRDQIRSEEDSDLRF